MHDLTRIGILGTGKYLPEKVLTNYDLEKIVDTSDEWITTRTGIKERRIAAREEKTSHLATRAAEMALKDAGVEAADIDLIIVATISPDSNFPSVACLVQKNIGAVNAAAFDLSAACAGFPYALAVGRRFIAAGSARRVLVIAAEKITSLIDWKDRSTCVLFGDGAGACVLGPVESPRGFLADDLKADGRHSDLMAVMQAELEPLDQTCHSIGKPVVRMEGRELFKIAVADMAEAVERVLQQSNLTIDDVDIIVPHQANDRIISAVAKKLNIPKEKFFINIHRYGNMSAASIAVALCEAKEEGRIKPNDIVVLVAFGAGLVTAATVSRW